MKVLLDECVPRRFKRSLVGHDCQTVPEAGFAGKKNGELRSLAEASGFEVFLTVDHGIPYQQNLGGRRIANRSCEVQVEPTCRPVASRGCLPSVSRIDRSC